METTPKVFCSYRSTDRDRVKPIAGRLREAGVDAWLDVWDEKELDAGITGKLQSALEECAVGLLFLSRNTPEPESQEGKWVRAEIDYFTHQAVERKKQVVLLRLDADVAIPPFLLDRPHFTAEQVDELIDLLRGARIAPSLGRGAIEAISFRIVLRTRERSLFVDAHRDGEKVLVDHPATVGPDFHHSLREFFEAHHSGARGPKEENAATHERALARLGEALGRALFPEPVANALEQALGDAARDGGEIALAFETEEPDLLSIPFEAARLGEGRVVALQPAVRVFRRLLGVEPKPIAPSPGPLKILVAVGAPDEGRTSNVVLDPEAELQTILDALTIANRGSQPAHARILEVGSPHEIAKALHAERYHVLHLSGHGGAGVIELEDEDGNAVGAGAEDLARAIRESGHPPPLVFLASCHGGTQVQDTTGLAEALLQRGVRQVVAMQSSVTDRYATELAGEFYARLAAAGLPRASRALAGARGAVEEWRRKEQGAARVPEYATCSLFQVGRERELVDRLATLELVPPRGRPLSIGAVPMLSIGDLVDRRVELRTCLRTLRGQSGKKRAGVQLTGIGGIGKSSIAGRVMSRLAEEGWAVASHSGVWTPAELAKSLGGGLLQAADGELRDAARQLATGELPDEASLALLAGLLARHRVLLVLDNQEDVLRDAGARYADELTASLFAHLMQAAVNGTGKLLVTTRYPLPSSRAWLESLHVPPLSTAQTRKLVWRLGSLSGRGSDDLRLVLRAVGGHPRMLEFLDAILARGESKVPDVAARLERLAEELEIDLRGSAPTMSEALESALQVGAGDILLDELLELLGPESDEVRLLNQIAVFPTPVTARELARTLASEGPEAEPAPTRERELRGSAERLARHSLVALVGMPGGEERHVVHRWTAELLRRRAPEEFREHARRAAAFLVWRLQNETRSLEDAVEATRLFLAAEQFEEATVLAGAAARFLHGRGQMVGLAQLANELHVALPEDHLALPGFLREEADALGALGLGAKGLELHRRALDICEARVRSRPDRTDYLRDLSVSHDRLGDVMRALGRGEEARGYYEKCWEIAERLVRQEPDQTSHLCDLSISYSKLGDVMGALGRGEEARGYYEKGLEIAERLVRQEPDRTDRLRDLSVSYNDLGHVMETLGQGEEARGYYEKGLEIRERLVRQEPERTDHLSDLSVSYNKLGDVMRALSRGEEARGYYEKGLEIRERLVRQEPERTDHLRNLSVSYNKLGDVMHALSRGEEARGYYENGLEICERLVRQEPDRADLQADLVVSLVRVGDRPALERALQILRELAADGRLEAAKLAWIPMLDQALRNLPE